VANERQILRGVLNNSDVSVPLRGKYRGKYNL